MFAYARSDVQDLEEPRADPATTESPLNRFRALAATTALLAAVFANCPARAAWFPTNLTGSPLCAATGDQTVPRSISDGGGGSIVAWSDARGASRDIYVQHISAVGVPPSLPTCVRHRPPGSLV